jgi:predicted TIM-barrel fold metal-dependent hydrolase
MIPIDSFPKIDAHIHFNAERTNVLQLAEQFGFSLLTINTEVPEFPSVEKQHELANAYDQQSAVDLFHAATVSTESVLEQDWAEQAIANIKRRLNEGACGVKFWKNIGMSIQRPDGSFLMPDDPELEPIFSFLEEERIPTLGHQGEPKNCWLPVDEMTVNSDREYFSAHPQYHMFKHDEYPDYWDHIEARDHILDRHPDLQFVGLHLASLEWSLDEVADRLDRYPNLAVDLAERQSHLYYHAAEDRQKVIDFFETYQDRIIYGTDIIDDPDQSPEAINEELERRWTEHWQFFSSNIEMASSQISSPFKGLALSEKILHKIYRTNAEKRYTL